jgi:hypothetical protein
MISHLLDMSLAKDGEIISSLETACAGIKAKIASLQNEADVIEFWIKRYLQEPNNLHFKDIESAIYYFEELVDSIMREFRGGNKVKDVLCDCYVDGMRYTPRFDGDKWAIGSEPFIEMFKLTGENDE